MDDALSTCVLTVTGTTDTVLDLVTDPNVLEMTALLDAVTGEVVTVNFAVSAPAGTVTEVGTRAITVFEDLS